MTPTGVNRLARVVKDLASRRRECAELRQLVDQLERSGLFVVQGESDLVRTLEASLGDADLQLQVLATTSADDVVSGQGLDTLEKLLSGVRWRQADGARSGLELRRSDLDRAAAELGSWLAPLTLRIETLERRLGHAVSAGVPQKDLKQEREALGRLKQLVKATEEAVKDGRLSVAIDIRSQLDAAGEVPVAAAMPVEPRVADLDLLGSAVEEKAAAGREMSQVADILLLKGAATEGDLEYTFVLRTPSAPGSQGISIHDTFDVGQHDWERANSGIALATGAVRSARARDLAPLPVPLEAGEAAGSGSVIDVLRDLGDFMYRVFVPGYAQGLLAGSAYPVSITTNDAELPWELLHDGEEFLCLTRPLARMPSGQAIPRRHRRRLAPRRLRFLLAHADPLGDLAEVKNEVEYIQARLQEAWAEQIELNVNPHPTGTFFNDALRHGDYDVIHYAGHAAFDDEEPGRSGLLLYADDGTTEVFSATKIRQFVEGSPLVFLNACRTGKAEGEEAGEVSYAAKPAEGLASAFIYGGALACIGSLWPVYDEPARHFAADFYNAVVDGTAIGRAMLDARRSTRDFRPDDPTWASFALFGNPTFRLDSSVEAAALAAHPFLSAG